MNISKSEYIEATKRLKDALELLGYKSSQPKISRHNLISQILSFAESNGDHQLASIAHEMAAAVRAE